MKTKILALTLVSLLVLAGSAFAAVQTLDTTDSSKSLTDTFLASETPYILYTENKTNPVTFQWFWGTNTTPVQTLVVPDGTYSGNFFATPNWATISQGKLGDWSVTGVQAPGATIVTANFKVVPEPISTTLFLLGAGVLGTHIYRRKKKA